MLLVLGRFAALFGSLTQLAKLASIRFQAYITHGLKDSLTLCYFCCSGDAVSAGRYRLLHCFRFAYNHRFTSRCIGDTLPTTQYNITTASGIAWPFIMPQQFISRRISASRRLTHYHFTAFCRYASSYRHLLTGCFAEYGCSTRKNSLQIFYCCQSPIPRFLPAGACLCIWFADKPCNTETVLKEAKIAWSLEPSDWDSI